MGLLDLWVFFKSFFFFLGKKSLVDCVFFLGDNYFIVYCNKSLKILHGFLCKKSLIRRLIVFFLPNNRGRINFLLSMIIMLKVSYRKKKKKPPIK